MASEHQDDAAQTQRDRNIIAQLAAEAGLKLVTPGDLTIRRRRAGKGFAYVAPDGGTIGDEDEKRRFEVLAVPPAYTHVFFAADPAFHIQAVGQDAAGRLQYRYHPDWTQVREGLKARRLIDFVDALPRIRRQVDKDLSARKLGRRQVLAAAVRLVERSAIRAGHDMHGQTTGARGAATLHKRDVSFGRGRICLAFTGKGGKAIARDVEDQSLARVLRRLLAIPGKRLFQYLDAAGRRRPISGHELNAYLRSAAGEAVSMKDFRTLIASSAAVEALADIEPADSARQRAGQIKVAVKAIAQELANTPAIVRKSYVHASVIDAFESGRLRRMKTRVKARPYSPRRERLLRAVVKKAAPGRRRHSQRAGGKDGRRSS